MKTATTRWATPAVRALALLLAGILLDSPAWAGGGTVLADAELELIHGGEPAESDGTSTRLHTVTVNTTQNITGPVQQGANSMISIIALNSAVNAQLNMLVGDVGHATQANLGTAGR